MACPARAGWKDVVMPKPYPKEFREDVVRVARSREAGVTLAQVAKDFGIHEMTLNKWLRKADAAESGAEPLVEVVRAP